MKKYDRTKSGFYGKKHSDYTKSLIGEGNKRAWIRGRVSRKVESSRVHSGWGIR